MFRQTGVRNSAARIRTGIDDLSLVEGRMLMFVDIAQLFLADFCHCVDILLEVSGAVLLL